jgi:hypothetical protein
MEDSKQEERQLKCFIIIPRQTIQASREILNIVSRAIRRFRRGYQHPTKSCDLGDRAKRLLEEHPDRKWPLIIEYGSPLEKSIGSLIQCAEHHLLFSPVFEKKSRPLVNENAPDDWKVYFRNEYTFWSDKLNVGSDGIITNRAFIDVFQGEESKVLHWEAGRNAEACRELGKSRFRELLMAMEWVCETFNMDEVSAAPEADGNAEYKVAGSETSDTSTVTGKLSTTKCCILC